MNIKFFSQIDKNVPENLKRQICGLACVKMIIDYYHPETEKNINELIREGELIGAYDSKINKGAWKHEGLVRIMRNHGIACYAQEFLSVKIDLETGSFSKNENEELLIQKGIEKIIKFVKRNKPVISSFRAGFGENTDSHLVLITGIKNDPENDVPVFLIQDPIVGSDIEISLNHFLKYWRKLTIFVN